MTKEGEEKRKDRGDKGEKSSSYVGIGMVHT
jgi:hypothetical protein